MRRGTRFIVVAGLADVALVVAGFLLHPFSRFGWPALVVQGGLGFPCGLFISRGLTLNRKERYGSHRSTEADSQDSSSDENAFTVSLGGSFYPVTYTSTSTGTSTGVAKTAELEVVESELPILAHRSALLRFDGTSNHFGTVNAGFGSFGIDADAHCRDLYGEMLSTYYRGERRKPHSAPGRFCTCGFYALPPDMASTYEGHNYVTLLVELSGTVIEHEHGYRAGHQRVIECQLPPCCYCGAQAEVVVVADHVMQEACCIGHTPKLAEGQVVLEVAAVQRLLPVPVTRLGKVHA